MGAGLLGQQKLGSREDLGFLSRGPAGPRFFWLGYPYLAMWVQLEALLEFFVHEKN